MTTETKDRSGRTTFPGTAPVQGNKVSQASGGSNQGGRVPRAAGRGLRILAFDAGNSTGTALYDGGDLTLGVVRGRAFVYELLASTPDLDALAYERFTIRQGLKEEHADVVYINGAIESEASRRGIPFYFYTPRQSKSRISDTLLKSMGWWPPFGMQTGGHAADAARILLCTLTDHYPAEMMEKP